MKVDVAEVLHRHFSGFGYGITPWASLSDQAKAGWRSEAIQIFQQIAHGDQPVVEVFYQKFRGKGSPPYNFKDAREKLQADWRSRVERFFLDLVPGNGPEIRV